MDDLAAMRMLIRVVDAGNFSAVARQLNVAPSSVSRLIGDLERDLGVRMFQRTTRKLSLTEQGQIYYERASHVLQELDDAKRAVAQGGAPTGVLRVTAPTAIGRELLISVIPAFLTAYPGLRVVMTLNDYVLDMVETGLDVAIRVGRLRDSTLKARRIGDSRLVVCASPAYLRRHGTPRHPADLERHNCITFRDQPGTTRWRFGSADGPVSVNVSGNFFARSSDGVVAAALAGLGLTLFPDWNMGIELRQKKLRVVLTDFEPLPRSAPVWAIHTHQQHVPPKVRAFIDFLVEQLADYQAS